METPQGKANRLVHEKSPYLLQHAYNPVDWYPWCEDAFDRAKQEDKPVFLSIGYATCHWCHVMERESFEDRHLAEFLNQHFICIKLDREERPDIDSIYMDALHAMGQQGGWPLNMFLTGDKKPITGGTYFPPTAKYGRKSFLEVLQIILQAWQDRKEEVIRTSNDITHYLKEIYSPRPDRGTPSHDSFHKAFQYFDRLYDEVYYGFKTGSNNKFPPSMSLRFLIHYYLASDIGKALEMAEHTLKALRRGGIYDHIGGGLSRYATDHQWLVPHFEKMLYDNALYVISLTEAYAISQNPFYHQVIEDIIRYINRDMYLPEGGVACAEDADSEGEEGKFYVWSWQELQQYCGQDFEQLQSIWHISEQGNFMGRNILHETINEKERITKKINEEKNRQIIERNRIILLRQRDKRIRPLRDDKVITSWNCLWIQALAIAGQKTANADWIEQAQDLYSFIITHLINSRGRLLRRYRQGQADFLANLSDYAELCMASLVLYRSNFKMSYLQNAIHFTNEAIQLFLSDYGPFYETGYDSEKLIRRSISSYDGVEPSGNSTMAGVLHTLLAYRIQVETYEPILDALYRYFKEELENVPMNHPALLTYFLKNQNHPKTIVIISASKNRETQKVLDYLHTGFFPEFDIIYCTEKELSEWQQTIPILQNRQINNELTIFICEQGQCQLPLYSEQQLRQSLEEYRHQGQLIF